MPPHHGRTNKGHPEGVLLMLAVKDNGFGHHRLRCSDKEYAQIENIWEVLRLAHPSAIRGAGSRTAGTSDF